MAAGEQDKSVEVLLATYNGEKFLTELLDSLLQQSFQEFTVLVSDDGSNDATTAILESFDVNHPGRFRLLSPSPSRLGASANFRRLINHASAEYLFFCDQDDVWLPKKMEATLSRMATLEARRRPSTPLMVHTDLIVVGSQLEMISDSFFRYSSINPVHNDLGSLFWSNVASGCTMMVNRALYSQARPIPDDGTMYDHWLAQVAAAVGEITCLPETTILYRQHGENVIGAKSDKKITSILKRICRPFCSKGALGTLNIQSRRAAVLLSRYELRLGPDRRNQVMALAKLWTIPWHKRFFCLWRNRVLRPTFLGNLSLFVLVLRNGNSTH